MAFAKLYFSKNMPAIAILRPKLSYFGMLKQKEADDGARKNLQTS